MLCNSVTLTKWSYVEDPYSPVT